MAERSTLGLAHQLLDLLRENQGQAVPIEHARLLVNLARALVRPQDAHEDMSGDYETGIALDLPGAVVDGPLSPALAKTADPELRSDIVDAAVTSVALVKTPEPREDGHEMDTLGVTAPAHSSLEHVDAPARSTYQPSTTVNTENDDSSASSNTALSTNRALHDSNAQDTALDAPLPPPAIVVSTMPALIQPPKCAVSAEPEPNVVPALYSGHQHIPAPGAASSTTVSLRSRYDAAHTKTELTESPALSPSIPPTQVSPTTKEEDTPILLLAKYPPPLPLQDLNRASPPAWMKTEPVDSPGLSSLPIGDETNASALPIPNSTYPPPSEVYQTHVKIEAVDSPALLPLPSSIASVRRPLMLTTEERDSSIPPSVPLENATAPRVQVRTELIEEDPLAALSMHVPFAQRNGGLHSPSSTAPCVIYHHSLIQTLPHAPVKAEPIDAFIPAVQPSPTEAGSTHIVYSADYLQGLASTPASAKVKAEHEDVDLAHEQEPLSSLAPSSTPPLVKAEPVDPSIPPMDEADTPILRLAKYPPAPAPTPVNDGDVQSLRTTHPSSLVTAASSAARNYYIPPPSTAGDFLTEQMALEIASAPPPHATAAVENAAYDDEIYLSTRHGDSVPEQTTHEIASAPAPTASSNAACSPILQQSPTTPGDSLPGQTVLEILSVTATLKPSFSSGATSAIPIAHPLPRAAHVESESLVTTYVASFSEDTQEPCEASTALSFSADADAVDPDTNFTLTRSPSPSACSITLNAASPSHASNSAATSAVGYANVFMLAPWSDDETSPVAEVDNAQQQDLFPPVPPPTPASPSPTSASPYPTVPRSPSPSPAPNVPHSPSPSLAASVLPVQTDFPTAAEASCDADAAMDVDEGSLPRAHEGVGAGTERQEQEQQQNVPRLLLRMSSPFTAPTQGQRDDTARADELAYEAPSSEVEPFAADGQEGEEDAAPHVPSLLRRMSGPGYDNGNNAGATEQQDQDDSALFTSHIFTRLGDVQTSMSGRASLRSRFDSPPSSLPLAERISPPSSVRAEYHGQSNFKRRHREDGMEDGGSEVGRSGSKRRRRK